MLGVALFDWRRSHQSFTCCSSRSGDSTTGVFRSRRSSISRKPASRPMRSRLWRRGAFEEINRLYHAAHGDPSAASLQAIRVRLAPAFAQAQRDLGTETWATPARPKAPLISPFFRWATVDGMVNPFGLEVLINPDVLDVERPYVVAHEWGYIAGWAREGEAGYVGWLTCMRGDDAARYSAWISLLSSSSWGSVSDRARADRFTTDAGPAQRLRRHTPAPRAGPARRSARELARVRRVSRRRIVWRKGYAATTRSSRSWSASRLIPRGGHVAAANRVKTEEQVADKRVTDRAGSRTRTGHGQRQVTDIADRSKEGRRFRLGASAPRAALCAAALSRNIACLRNLRDPRNGRFRAMFQQDATRATAAPTSGSSAEWRNADELVGGERRIQQLRDARSRLTMQGRLRHTSARP